MLFRSFPTERRDEAWQRLMDQEFFSAARYLDDEFNDIINRYHAQYILVASDRPLTLQLSHLPSWFTLIDQAGGYNLNSIAPIRPSHPVVEAGTAMSRGDWAAAEALFTQALNGTPDDHYLALLGLSRTTQFQGDIQQTLEYLRQAEAIHPEEALLHEIKGATFIAAGDLPSALSAYQRAQSLMPSSGYLTFRLADAYRLLGQNDAARQKYIESVLTRAPVVDTPLYYMLLGQAYQHAGWYEDSIASFQRVVALLPVVLEPRIAIGSVYLTQGKLDEAGQVYQQALDFDRWSASPRLGLAQVATQRGESERAIDLYRQAISLDQATNIGYTLFLSEYLDSHTTDETVAAVKNLIGFQLSMPGALTAF